jgi:hypothetical protein
MEKKYLFEVTVTFDHGSNFYDEWDEWEINKEILFYVFAKDYKEAEIKFKEKLEKNKKTETCPYFSEEWSYITKFKKVANSNCVIL